MIKVFAFGSDKRIKLKDHVQKNKTVTSTQPPAISVIF